MGKTSLATNIAYNIAKSFKKNDNADGTSETVNGGIVGFYSLEMSAEQLAARILSETAEIPSEQIRRGDMTESEFRGSLKPLSLLKVHHYLLTTPQR